MEPTLLAANATAPAAPVPPNMLDGLFPGFSVFRTVVLSSFGIDIGLVVTFAALVVGLGKAAGMVGRWLYDNVLTYLMTTVVINDNDDLFDSFKTWAADNAVSRHARATQAVTPWRNLLLSYDYSASSRTSSPNKLADDAERLFNFQEAQANSRLRNELHMGANFFSFRGRPFYVRREFRDRGTSISYRGKEEKQRFALTCLGRSRHPLMNLLEHVRRHAAGEEQGFTRVIRPDARWGDLEWTTATVRTIRSLQSVIMDHAQKVRVARDLNTFIWPESSKWYASRGIPHRRGYLFSGPPGTGKTSLAFALSGIFGLKLHVISLTDKSLSDSGLLGLFCELPDRCIVLLEDVDAAGLKREHVEGVKKAKRSQSAKDDGDIDNDDDDEEHNAEKNNKIKITLSGLLNAIDGVATHEGRVIIMTSNCPDELDPALIRPGRIDEHIRFNLATRQQITELFLAMYSTTAGGDTRNLTLGVACAEIHSSEDRESDVPGVSMDELRTMSQDFADKISEEYFSPAEVQGFLLPQDRRCDPRVALRDIDDWVVKTKAEKEKKVVEEAAKKAEKDRRKGEREARRSEKERKRAAEQQSKQGKEAEEEEVVSGKELDKGIQTPTINLREMTPPHTPGRASTPEGDVSAPGKTENTTFIAKSAPTDSSSPDPSAHRLDSSELAAKTTA